MRSSATSPLTGLAAGLACTLALTACSGPDDPPTGTPPSADDTPSAAVEPSADRILDDFPLTSGWEPGLARPRRADADLPGCGDGGAPPDRPAADRLVAGWTKERRTRQLSVYATAADATAAVRELLGYYRACTATAYADGDARPRTVVQTVTGGPGPGARWQVQQAPRGGDASAGTVLQVVRVGRSVLLDVATGPGGSGRWEARARRIAADQVRWGAGVVAAMDAL